MGSSTRSALWGRKLRHPSGRDHQRSQDIEIVSMLRGERRFEQVDNLLGYGAAIEAGSSHEQIIEIIVNTY